MCRGEPVPGVGKTEDQLIKYQWTMKKTVRRQKLLGKLLCSGLCLTKRGMYSKNDQLNWQLK